MLSARTGLPGHIVYNRVRNAIEMVEMKMGNVFAADALRLAALRKALGCEAPDNEPDFPSSLEDMSFDAGTLDVAFTDAHAVRAIELNVKQITLAAQKVIKGALADGAWRSLASISLIGHQLLESTAVDIIEATKSRGCGFFGGSKEVSLEGTILQPADTKLIAATLLAPVPLHSLELQGCELGPDALRAMAKGLSSHTSLKRMYLNGNPLGNGGAIALADGLKGNRSVELCHFEYCDVGGPGAKAIGEMLAVNTTLTDVSLPMTDTFMPHWNAGSGNEFDAEGVTALAKGVLASKSLKTFGSSPMVWLRIEWGAGDLPPAAELLAHPCMSVSRVFGAEEDGAKHKTPQAILDAETAAVEAQRRAGGEGGGAPVVLRRLIGVPGEAIVHDVPAQKISFFPFTTVGADEAVATSGVYYYELTLTDSSSMMAQWGFASTAMEIGIDTQHCDGVGDDAGSWGVDGLRQFKFHDGTDRWEGEWADNDVIGLAVNVDAGMIAASKNGDWAAPGHGVVFADEKIKAGVYPAFSASTGDVPYRMAAPFRHAPPPAELWAEAAAGA